MISSTFLKAVLVIYITLGLGLLPGLQYTSMQLRFYQKQNVTLHKTDYRMPKRQFY